MANEQIFHVGIKALIENKEGRVLLLKADVSTHKKNVEAYWDIPGGRIKEGNDILQTLQREIEEETGISNIGKPAFVTAVVSNHEIPLDDGTLAGLILMIYKVTIPVDSTITISEEHSDYEWVSKTEAATRLSHKYPKEFTDLL